MKENFTLNWVILIFFGKVTLKKFGGGGSEKSLVFFSNVTWSSRTQ